MANEVDAIDAAVIETNREIAAEAWDQEAVELDHTGDRTAEDVGEGPEGQVEVEEEDAEAETEVEADAEETPAEETAETAKPNAETEKPPVREPEGRVPSARLREVTEKSRALETERDALKTELANSQASSRKEVEALNARLDGVLAAIRQQPKGPQAEQQPVAETIPDMFEDPKGFAEYLQNGFRAELSKRDQQIQNLSVETSMQIAHSIHKDAFTKAVEAVKQLNPQNPDDRVTVQRIYASPNPGQALVDWHKRSETLREVGDDPAKYREKLIAEERTKLMADPEFRKQLLADLHAEANGGPNGKPNTITRLPKSLNGAPGGSRPGVASSDFDGSPQAIAESAWR